jgi:glycosyl transferase family 87
VIFINVALLAFLLLLAHRSPRLTRVARGTAAGAFALWTAWSALPMVRDARWNLTAPREWDFVCFWLWGRTAALRLDFYDPSQIQAVASSLEASDEFSRLILQGGFWYPPPSMLIFAPLGLLPLRGAMLCWYLVQAVFAAGAAWLLWRTFLGEIGVLGLVTAAAMLVALPPTRSTAWFAQTNFVMLFLFLLLLRYRDKPWAGVYLALGAIVKPYFLFLLGYFLLKRAWKAIAVACGTLLVSVGVSAALFGLAPLASFVATNPTSRIPGYVYGEPINQSILGMLVRAGSGSLEGSIMRQPLYLAIATLLAVTTAWAMRHADLTRQHGIGLCLSLALLLYPATLTHYSVVLLAPMLAYFRDRRELPLGTTGVVLLVSLVYCILGWDRFESHNFWANLLVWAAGAAVCLYPCMNRGRDVVVPARS